MFKVRTNHIPSKKEISSISTRPNSSAEETIICILFQENMRKERLPRVSRAKCLRVPGLKNIQLPPAKGPGTAKGLICKRVLTPFYGKKFQKKPHESFRRSVFLPHQSGSIHNKYNVFMAIMCLRKLRDMEGWITSLNQIDCLFQNSAWSNFRVDYRGKMLALKHFHRSRN